ncbi:MAG: superoxide dismutase, partial [Bacteroidota bacterium]|nr:superoxide dismutase [Bacteroidota bacterium]
MSFKLPDLSYDYNALEPYIDGRTMEIHHSKHHAAYTANLNKAVEGTSLEGSSIEEIFAGL